MPIHVDSIWEHNDFPTLKQPTRPNRFRVNVSEGDVVGFRFEDEAGKRGKPNFMTQGEFASNFTELEPSPVKHAPTPKTPAKQDATMKVSQAAGGQMPVQGIKLPER